MWYLFGGIIIVVTLLFVISRESDDMTNLGYDPLETQHITRKKDV